MVGTVVVCAALAVGLAGLGVPFERGRRSSGDRSATCEHLCSSGEFVAGAHAAALDLVHDHDQHVITPDARPTVAGTLLSGGAVGKSVDVYDIPTKKSWSLGPATPQDEASIVEVERPETLGAVRIRWTFDIGSSAVEVDDRSQR